MTETGIDQVLAHLSQDPVKMLAKYVRPDKVDGAYLPEQSGKEPVWNWRESD